MANLLATSVVHQLESLFDGGSVAGLSDRQLLDRFVARRDAAGEAAFAALVARHGPMVLGVCRQLLGDRHHAEDTFQAVFLVLARKAASIRDPDLLGNWLYGVALRTARKGKARLGRQRRQEEGNAMNGQGRGAGATVEPMAPPADQPAIDRELAEILHDEIDRLPSPFRLPVVLCYFEGLTLEAAARRLRWPEGTLRSRLARARDKLRRGLTRRDVVLPDAVLAAVLDSKPASAAVSSPLCDITTKAAIQFAAGRAVSPLATALAREVLRSMFVNKLKLAALTVLFLGAVASGAVFVGQVSERQAGKPDLRERQAGKPDLQNPKPAPGRMFVLGRVLDPQGKPVPNATTMVYARGKAIGHSPSISRMSPIPIGNARADGSGRFRIDAPRTSSSRYDTFGAVAIAPGYGAGWIELDPDTDQPTADITLWPEQVIQGRLFDLQGRPARGVSITVRTMFRIVQRGGGPGGRDRLEAVHFWWADATKLSAWPQPATTDDQGRFALHGVGRGSRVFLTVDDLRFASQRIQLDTADSKPLTMALEPAKIINGRVTYADTGKPVPRALLMVQSYKREGGGRGDTEFETDADGRFRINPTSGDGYNVRAYPPAGQPYLSIMQRFEWPKGAIEHSLDLDLPRGVSIHGKVTEEGSGQPIAAATVRFIAFAERGNAASNSGSTVLDTAADGSFQFGALPSPGYLSVIGPSDDYVLQTIGDQMVKTGQPGGRRFYSHANIRLDLKPGIRDKEVHVALRRGTTVKGRVIGPEGQPVRDTSMISRIILGPTTIPWKNWRGDYQGHAHDGRFEVHGLDPDAETPVHFFEPKREARRDRSFLGQVRGRWAHHRPA